MISTMVLKKLGRYVRGRPVQRFMKSSVDVRLGWNSRERPARPCLGYRE